MYTILLSKSEDSHLQLFDTIDQSISHVLVMLNGNKTVHCMETFDVNVDVFVPKYVYKVLYATTCR